MAIQNEHFEGGKTNVKRVLASDEWCGTFIAALIESQDCRDDVILVMIYGRVPKTILYRGFPRMMNRALSLNQLRSKMPGLTASGRAMFLGRPVDGRTIWVYNVQSGQFEAMTNRAFQELIAQKLRAIDLFREAAREINSRPSHRILPSAGTF